MKITSLFLLPGILLTASLLSSCVKETDNASPNNADDDNTKKSDDNRVEGIFKSVLVGSSGHATIMLHKTDTTKNKVNLHFDSNQDGTDDINVDVTGHHVRPDLEGGFTHSETGVNVKLTMDTDTTDGHEHPTLTVTVPKHGSIVAVTEKATTTDGAELVMYRGETGRKVKDGGQETFDSRTIFNVILNTTDKTFDYVTKGLVVGEHLSEKEKKAQEDSFKSHIGETFSSTYTVDGDVYTFDISGDRKEVLTKDSKGNLTMEELDFKQVNEQTQEEEDVYKYTELLIKQ